MSENENIDLPPRFADVSERLRAARPAASDQVLDGALLRAQQAASASRRSLLWTSGPALGGRTRTIAVATSLAVVGMTSAAAVINSNVSGGGLPVVNGDAAVSQYCPAGLAVLQAEIAALQTQLNLAVLNGNNPLIVVPLQTNIANLQAQALLCVQFP